MIERVHQVVEDAFEVPELEEVDLDENNHGNPSSAKRLLQFEVPSTQHLSHASSTCVRKRVILPVRFQGTGLPFNKEGRKKPTGTTSEKTPNGYPITIT
jgi:hypothetical protein